MGRVIAVLALLVSACGSDAVSFAHASPSPSGVFVYAENEQELRTAL